MNHRKGPAKESDARKRPKAGFDREKRAVRQTEEGEGTSMVQRDQKTESPRVARRCKLNHRGGLAIEGLAQRLQRLAAEQHFTGSIQVCPLATRPDDRDATGSRCNNDDQVPRRGRRAGGLKEAARPKGKDKRTEAIREKPDR